MMAKNSRKIMKRKVSRLLAVTRFTPNRMVRSSFPCDVLKLFRSTKAMQPLSPAGKGGGENVSLILSMELGDSVIQREEIKMPFL